MRCIPALGQAMMITSLSSSKPGEQMSFQYCQPCSNFDAKVRLQQHIFRIFLRAGVGLEKNEIGIWRGPFSHTEIGH